VGPSAAPQPAFLPPLGHGFPGSETPSRTGRRATSDRPGDHAPIEGLFASESVAEGHPDKLANRSSDKVLDAFLRREPNARVACERMLADQCVIIAGEFRTSEPQVFLDVRQDTVRLVAPRAAWCTRSSALRTCSR
jgi:hypothetical protein